MDSPLEWRRTWENWVAREGGRDEDEDASDQRGAFAVSGGVGLGVADHALEPRPGLVREDALEQSLVASSGLRL